MCTIRCLISVGQTDEDSEDDNERPLTSEELKAKTLRGLAKKEGTGARRSKKKR